MFTCTCYLFIYFSQPTRLNVFKNDQDTWDYTNPNLGGPGKTSKQSLLKDLRLTGSPLSAGAFI